ncbi:hypothetical protein HYFRA_00010361 [Hymenoscyphus fraxineus]|uniref:Heterokaryon incompatibility domain-containing protein n=1 Tax=Hymenoscyphus fraxineus TaxID=746836 RepID=A0A9N9KXV5_9HELO|nr:hypothetical protein HYFRA_00010361 [Hymenoscyphus fraxineus]
MLSGDQIRVLDLLPSFQGDEPALVRCETRIVSLADKPQYEALSYVWGGPIPRSYITVSGCEVDITSSLYAILCRLRLGGECKRTLWIDQLCINQQDPEEKTSQVRLMRRIYKSCTTCLLWMGDIREDIAVSGPEAALDFFRYLAAVNQAADPDALLIPESMRSRANFETMMVALRSIMAAQGGWWTRVWTVQEAILPTNSTLVWGPLSIPWHVLTKATEAWKNGLPSSSHELNPGSFPDFSRIMARMIWLDNCKGLKDSPLHTIIRYREREATDGHDKIYALLGLLPVGALPETEKCNYQRTVARTYCLATIELILNEKSLSPLTIDPWLEDEQATEEMPRWALDLSQVSKYDRSWEHIHRYPIYNANGSRELDLETLRETLRETIRLQESSASPKLPLSGHAVDTIALVGECLQEDDLDNTLMVMKSWKSLTENFHRTNNFQSPAHYPGGSRGTVDAFCRTMLGDLVHGWDNFPKYWATDFEANKVLQFLESGTPQYWREQVPGSSDGILTTVEAQVVHRAFFITKTGLLGLGHPKTACGDQVWVFDGGRVPFTIRSKKNSASHPSDYDFVGRCYVQGIMKGELFKDVDHIETQIANLF